MDEAREVTSTSARLPWSSPKLWEEHHASATFAGEGGLQTDPHRHADVDIDAIPPSGQAWLSDVAGRLAAKPDSPVRVTDAARQVANEMREAFLRRRVAAGPDFVDQFRRAAGYVDRILKGEKPASTSW